jgi:hypothetical protein
MKHKAARREVLSALAEFERACVEFSAGVRRSAEAATTPADLASPLPLLELGPRKAARRAPRRTAAPLKVREAGR